MVLLREDNGGREREGERETMESTNEKYIYMWVRRFYGTLYMKLLHPSCRLPFLSFEHHYFVRYEYYLRAKRIV